MIKKINYYLFALLASFFLVSGCLDEIQLDVPGKERETLVIQAKLEKGNPSVVEALVNKLFDFTSSSRIPVVVKSVILIDEDGNTKDLEANSLNGYVAVIEENDPDISIDFGRAYQLKVATFDGREFISELEILDPVPVPDGLTWEKAVVTDDSTGIQENILQFYISTPLISDLGNGSPSNLRWDLETAYQATDAPITGMEPPKICYITVPSELSKIKTVDGNELADNRIDRFLIAETKVSSIFAEGLYFNVFQESLGEKALQYWEQVGELVDRSGNMFEAPVGKLVTNFSNTGEAADDEIFGYFYATSQEVIRIFVEPGEVGNPSPTCPWTGQVAPGRGCTIPQICCDCSVLDGASTTKPDYWQ